MSSNRVVIFSKSADTETVKTRMRPRLSPEQCLSLHLSLLKDTLSKVSVFSSVLYLTGSGDLPFETGLPVRSQSGVDLGERMLNAFISEFRQFSKVVIIGTDSPTVPAEEIKKAFLAMDRHDLVLGPCEDGGYYLVGLREIIPEIFHGIPWGTADVLTKTLERISDHSYVLLDSYFDVDLPQDLLKLRDNLTPATSQSDNLKYTRAWISDYFGPSAR